MKINSLWRVAGRTMVVAGFAWGLTVTTGSAQVYSANCLGYVDVSWVAGSNLIANPFNARPNTISNVLRGLPDGSYFIPFIPGRTNSGPTNFYSAASGWSDPEASGLWFLMEQISPTPGTRSLSTQEIRDVYRAGEEAVVALVQALQDRIAQLETLVPRTKSSWWCSAWVLATACAAINCSSQRVSSRSWRWPAEGGRRRLGLVALAVIGEHARINPVGFGPLPLGLGGGAHLRGINDGDEDLGLLERLDQVLFIAAGGLANDVGAGQLLELPAQLFVAGATVGQLALAALHMDLERGFSDINSDIDRGRIGIHSFHGVQTQPYKYELAAQAAAPATVRVLSSRRRRL